MTNNRIDLSLEDRLLGYGANPKIDKKIEEIWDSDLNWAYILNESIKQGIPSLFYNNLLPFKSKIPENSWNKFKEIYYAIANRNTLIYQELRIILSSFNKENLKVIPLKGVFLAQKIYHNIALRPMADIDLLVKKEELNKIDELLNSLGYRSPVHKALLSQAIKKSYVNSIDYLKNDYSLHIHWHIVNITLPTYMYSQHIEMDRFWKEAKPVTIDGVETLQLTPTHLIIYLAEHALKHSFDKLILLCDINEVIKTYGDQIDWGDLIEEAMRLGMEKQLFYSLYFANYFLGAQIPDQVLSRLKPEKVGFLEKRFFNAVTQNNRNIKISYFVYLNMNKGVTNKLRFIFRTLFPPPSVLALTLNLNKPRVTLGDYLYFLKEQSTHLKNFLMFLISRR